jgi:hypothetical protein
MKLAQNGTRGWNGIFHLPAFKHRLMDSWSNSAAEGFCWAGFNGSPKIFDSLDPLIDILVTTSVGDDVGGVEWSSSSGIVNGLQEVIYVWLVDGANIMMRYESRGWRAALAAQGLLSHTEHDTTHIFDWNDSSSNNSIWSSILSYNQVGSTTLEEDRLTPLTLVY